MLLLLLPVAPLGVMAAFEEPMGEDTPMGRGVVTPAPVPIAPMPLDGRGLCSMLLPPPIPLPLPLAGVKADAVVAAVDVVGVAIIIEAWFGLDAAAPAAAPATRPLPPTPCMPVDEPGWMKRRLSRRRISVT